jgi:hypothetical protein
MKFEFLNFRFLKFQIFEIPIFEFMIFNINKIVKIQLIEFHYKRIIHDNTINNLKELYKLKLISKISLNINIGNNGKTR